MGFTTVIPRAVCYALQLALIFIHSDRPQWFANMLQQKLRNYADLVLLLFCLLYVRGFNHQPQIV